MLTPPRPRLFASLYSNKGANPLFRLDLALCQTFSDEAQARRKQPSALKSSLSAIGAKWWSSVGPLDLITRDNVAARAPALRYGQPLSRFAASAR